MRADSDRYPMDNIVFKIPFDPSTTNMVIFIFLFNKKISSGYGNKISDKLDFTFACEIG